MTEHSTAQHGTYKLGAELGLWHPTELGFSPVSTTYQFCDFGLLTLSLFHLLNPSDFLWGPSEILYLNHLPPFIVRIKHSITFYLFVELFFGLTAWHVESFFPDQGSNPHPLQWKHEFLTTGPPGKSLQLVILRVARASFCPFNVIFLSFLKPNY